ncbi:unnamed protein product [Psylliodes chrysocephalus]|uniref:HAT C-terminal dimerisation domain-containing protein n=1 Tax=Psylliodes chrysocephalus TaxID=3402493 RepID=A0A9P0GHN3_9CUCU|nr:unnamed protein product [Psylliodes chrysocephala]
MEKFLIKEPKLDCAQSSNIIVTTNLTSSGNNDTNEREPISENIGERQLQKDDNWVLDFGTYFGKIIDNVTKRKLLETPWSPDMSFKFPSSGPRNLKFQIKWLNEWSSPTLDSVFYIYLKTKRICDEFDITILQPKTTYRQTKRNNVPGSSQEEYYRRALYIPFLDQLIQAIDAKFLNHKNTLEPFQKLLCNNNSLDIKEVFNSTQHLLEFYELDDSGAMGEVTLWVQFIKDKTEKPRSAIEALERCNKNLFPTIHKLLIIMATLSVTTFSCERSFSSLKFLKNYLRNATSEDRLNGLALMYIHPDIPILEDEVLDVLALQSRRLTILL